MWPPCGHHEATQAGTTRAPQRSTIRRVFSGLLLGLAFCALALAGYQVGTGQWHATPVLSGSMRPAMQPGDVVVTQRVPVGDLQVRDVVVFHPPNEGGRQTVHRIVKLTVKGGTTSITTWGDANAVADPVVSSLSGTTAYRVARVVPLLGYPAVWLQSGGRGMLAIALGAILLIAAVVALLRPVKPAKPSGSAGSADPADPADISGDRADISGDRADISVDPHEAAAR
jgi:signal peptidase I